MLSETTPVDSFHIRGIHATGRQLSTAYPLAGSLNTTFFFCPASSTLRLPSSHSEHRQLVLQFGHEGRSASSTRILELRRDLEPSS